jgi:WXG100 family type VII secretion target
MAVTHVDANVMNTVALEFSSQIKVLEDKKKEVQTATETLLNSWQGEGKDCFEKQYRLLFGQLADITESLYNIYDDLVESGKSYVDADEQLKKSMELSQS